MVKIFGVIISALLDYLIFKLALATQIFLSLELSIMVLLIIVISNAIIIKYSFKE